MHPTDSWHVGFDLLFSSTVSFCFSSRSPVSFNALYFYKKCLQMGQKSSNLSSYYVLTKKKYITSLPSLVPSLKDCLVLLFKNYCVYIGALFNNSFPCQIPGFFTGLSLPGAVIEGLHSVRIFDLSVKENTREVEKGGRPFKSGPCLPISFLPFSEMVKPFLLRNNQNYFQWGTEIKPGKYQLRGESLALLHVTAKIF